MTSLQFIHIDIYNIIFYHKFGNNSFYTLGGLLYEDIDWR